MKIGQKIWYVSSHNQKLHETKISKIGKKYFETENKYLGKLDIKTLKHYSKGYILFYKIYLSEQQYYDEIEADKIFREIKNLLNTSSHLNFGLDKLKQILSIIKSSKT